MYIRNGFPFDIMAGHLIDDFQYPPGWFFDTDEAIAKGVIKVPYPVAPEVEPTQVAELTHFNSGGDGVWVPQWNIRDLTTEELEAMKPPVPQEVTRRQARQALLIRGLLDDIEAAILDLDDGTDAGKQLSRLALIEWQDSLNFERNRPLVIQIGLAVGLDATGLDELFIFAATL